MVYPDFREVYITPGTEDMFVLSEYKLALCKESYKRLTFYLIQRDEFNDNSDELCDSPKPESKIPEQPNFFETRLEDYMLPNMEDVPLFRLFKFVLINIYALVSVSQDVDETHCR